MLIIRKGGHRDLEKYYSMMEVDFDAAELLPKMAIHKAMLNGDQELLILSEDESKMDLAYALVMSRGIYGYALIKYFSVLPWYRGKGVGLDFMRLLHKRYAETQGLIAELTAFEDENGDYLRKLEKFFSRFGYEKQELSYFVGGQSALLYVKPVKGPADISPVAKRIITDLYSRCISRTAAEKMASFGK